MFFSSIYDKMVKIKTFWKIFINEHNKQVLYFKSAKFWSHFSIIASLKKYLSQKANTQKKRIKFLK